MITDVASRTRGEPSTGFGRRLKQARQRAGLNGPELAAKIDVVSSSIPHYEMGHTLPSVGVLKKMARALGVPADYLLFDEYEKQQLIQDKELAAYITKADLLGYQERALIKGMIDGMLARIELEEIKRIPGKRKKVA